MDQAYLGDGLYARWDGYQIELRVNDPIHPTDTVYLEPRVLDALNDWWSGIVEGTE